MKTLLITLLIGSATVLASAQEKSPANIRLKDVTLMHEMRATPFPLDKAVVSEKAVSFMWPLQEDQPIRTGFESDEELKKGKTDKSKLRYVLRYSQDPTFKTGTTEVETRWPFFNPEKPLAPGVWHWQYGYVNNGKKAWATTQQVTVADNPNKFCPPSLKELLASVPKEHPRVWMDKKEWNTFIRRNANAPERKTYISRANKALKTPMKSVNDIKVGMVKGLKNASQRQAMLTRESRRVVDGEESNIDALVRAYLLTKERKYANEAIHRVKEMSTWGENKNVVGDFNHSTILSVCCVVYDSLYDLLDESTRQQLRNVIREYTGEMYDKYNNHFENHIADNHVVQMTLRIFTMAVFTIYGEVPEADTWVDYAYNVWIARFPGVNYDGAWHNGDSYFQVNFRTLVEVPFLYTRFTGFNYFSDPWYQGNAMYTIYQQPPFSKSGGNGSGHQEKLQPHGVRIGYADAIARMTQNSYLADYVRIAQKAKKNILNEGSTGKGNGLAWFRLLCDKPLPDQKPGLADLPFGYVFPASGLASFSTNLAKTQRSAMISFRSSPYGSTSHAIANQNAFNTFYGGQSLFYSSGHHTAFVDRFSLLCERSTRTHNTILVNGMGQRIGTEGYGWIPRYYVGKKIGYVMGDASNAYGKVISPLWLKRAKEAEIELSPENGWDDVPLKTFRRHIVELGQTGMTFIYDELEASEPVTWSYLLHTVINPMSVDRNTPGCVHIQATNEKGICDAYLYSTDELKTDTTSQFFVPAVNWLKADANGKFAQDPNHWHFTATSGKQKVYRFATIINTHAKPKEGDKPAAIPKQQKDGSIRIGSWVIKANLSAEGTPSFSVRCTRKDYDASVNYSGKATKVREDGYETRLVDKKPDLEI